MPTASSGPHQFLRLWRKKAGLTQEQLGEAIGAKTSTISMIENGHQGVTLEQLAGMAEAMGVSSAELLGPPPSPDKAKADQMRLEILEIYDRLPKNLQPIYLAQARALLGATQDPE